MLGRCTDVHAANSLAAELWAGFRPGANLLRSIFPDPGAPTAPPDWHQIAADWVTSLRAGVGSDLDDPQPTALVGELSLKSGGAPSVSATPPCVCPSRARHSSPSAPPDSTNGQTLRLLAGLSSPTLEIRPVPALHNRQDPPERRPASQLLSETCRRLWATSILAQPDVMTGPVAASTALRPTPWRHSCRVTAMETATIEG